MKCPGFVRAVALVMLLIGLQAGSFGDLSASDERYYGTPDHSAALRPEPRKPDAVPLPDAAAQPPIARRPAGAQPRPALSRTDAGGFPAHVVPDPTGPPPA